MSHPLNVSTAVCAASIIGALALWNSPAIAKSVTSCNGDTRASVVACCEKIVTQNGMPGWMSRTDLSCHAVVSCSLKKKSDERCYVKARSLSRELGGQKGNQKGNESRGKL
jgi:hypothetical protein